MKAIKISILLLVLSVSAYAQTVNKSNIVVSFYFTTMHDELGFTRDVQLQDTVFKMITKKLTSESGFAFKDYKELKAKKMPFNFAGYPMASGKKVAKTNYAQNYMKLVVQVLPDGMYTKKESSITGGSGVGVGKSKVKAKIKVVINAVIFDSKGAKIKDVKVLAASADKIEISEEMLIFGKSTLGQYNEAVTENETFYSVLNQACTKLTKELK